MGENLRANNEGEPTILNVPLDILRADTGYLDQTASARNTSVLDVIASTLHVGTTLDMEDLTKEGKEEFEEFLSFKMDAKNVYARLYIGMKMNEPDYQIVNGLVQTTGRSQGDIASYLLHRTVEYKKEYWKQRWQHMNQDNPQPFPHFDEWYKSITIKD